MVQHKFNRRVRRGSRTGCEECDEEVGTRLMIADLLAPCTLTTSGDRQWRDNRLPMGRHVRQTCTTEADGSATPPTEPIQLQLDLGITT